MGNNKEKAITVGELIEILKQFPGNMIVITDSLKNGFEEILYPEIIEVRHEPDTMYEYEGEYQIADDGNFNTIKAVAIFRNRRYD